MAKPPIDSDATETVAQDALDHDGDGHKGGSAPPPAGQTFLTTRHTDQYGPGGRFVDLSAQAAAPGLAGDEPALTVPTAEQLTRRRP
jgi:hypothetical protein